MKFVLNLTIREIRSSWRSLLFFFLCIAIGVGSIVALRSLIQNLNRAVGGDAREFLTADIRIRSNADFSPAMIAAIDEAIKESGTVEERTETIDTNAMARSSESDKAAVEFVQVRGVEQPFPLVGRFDSPSGDFELKMLENGGAFVAPVLLEDLGVRVGQKIRIGEGLYTIRGFYESEPGGGRLQFGSRVYVSKKAFEQGGLAGERGNITRNILLKTSNDPTSLAKSLRDRLEGTNARVQTYKESEERIGEQFSRTEDFLSLTGLLILVLGGIGIWNVVRVFVDQRRSSIAILKCLGAKTTRIILVYTLQIGILGFLGSLFGVILAQLTLLLAKTQFNDALPEEMSYSISFSNAMQGLFIGIVISLIFSLLPLLRIRNIAPRLLLHDPNNEKLHSFDWLRIGIAVASVAILLGLAVWQAGSVLVGIYFLGGLAAVSIALYIAALILTLIVKRFRHIRWFPLSQAVNSLYRPGNQTRVVLLAVGLGVFVIMSVQILQANLIREFDLSENQRLPSLFFVDIQNSQAEPFQTLVKKETNESPEIVPTVRARISYVNGKPINFNDREVKQEQGQIGREFAVTYRENLDENETIIEGEWWTGVKTQFPEVSVEERMAKRLKVETGDSITFDISGRLITAQVASLRSLDLRNTRTAFVFVFQPGSLDNAPKSFAASLLKRISSSDRQFLQRDILNAFPNVRIIDVAEIVALIKDLVANFIIAISFVGVFVLISGILILIGSVALTRAQRVYENAVLKTLGANRATLATTIIFEYGLLGLLAGVIGSLFAVALSYATTIYVLRIEWELQMSIVVSGILATTFLVTIVGSLASIGVIYKKPLSILRRG